MTIQIKQLQLKHLIVLLLIVSSYSCKSLYSEAYKKPELVDKKLSKSAKKLHKKLFFTSKKGFVVGHQDATAYGIGWKYDPNSNADKSDINEISGEQPAMYSFEIGHIELGYKNNLDSIPFETMKTLIIDAHKKGGIISLSWHPDNPTTGGSAWDSVPAVKDVIGKGIHKEKYNLWVSRVADFIKDLKYKGENIPIIFRPFHEMNGFWFWWGDPSTLPEDYKQLWQETVHLLRDKHKLHNLMYGYSPNKLTPGYDYLKYYPGDDYVDFLGVDIYDFNNTEEFVASLVNDIRIMKRIATEKNKLFALTETGLEKIPTDNWFTEVLYPNIKDTGISWVLFWRNAHKGHYYIPYKDHKNADDFRKFTTFPQTLFLKDINN
ncbi:glycosyl hydrolase [uncultured Algibacter sp.]|uniref:glycoside hydrolase family 26 protein n=1 Tax=uncultured Algibacter sp. TaxID=298659 RepID=UPI00260214BA|nr:glycosyl hydrolase [uncultured Algibacter sp.]